MEGAFRFVVDVMLYRFLMAYPWRSRDCGHATDRGHSTVLSSSSLRGAHVRGEMLTEEKETEILLASIHHKV